MTTKRPFRAQERISFYRDYVAGLIDRFDRLEAAAIASRSKEGIRRPVLSPTDRQILADLHHFILEVQCLAYREALETLSKDRQPEPPGQRKDSSWKKPP